jgi:outer membrane protein assembly factor BamB
MTTALPVQQPHSPSAPGRRLWFLILVGILAAISLTVVRLQPDLERNFKGLATFAVFFFAALLALIWFFFLSRVAGRTRLVTFVLLILAVFGLKKSLRVDGAVDGTGTPKFAWRWTPTRAALPAALPATSDKTAALPSAAMAYVPAVPQFFGPNRDGVVHNANLAHDWNTTPPKQLWRAPVGAGWSAFAVVGGRAYTQEQRADGETVTCYDLLTGKLLWAHANPVHFSQWQGGDGPRATPTVDGGHVFAIGATGILDCLDAATGQKIWSRDVLGENKLENLIWGVSASPLVFDDTVVVTGGLTKGPTLFAYRKSSGEPLWKSGTDKASYSSPILTTLAGRRVILVINAASLTAHDPATGEELLNYPWLGDWPKAAQPVVIDGHHLLISAGYGLGSTLLDIQASPEGKLAATQVWKNMRMKTQFNSAALRDGFLYGIDDGILACIDATTGERKWKDGHFGSGQTLLADDLILIQSESGPVILAEAHPDGYKELGRLPALSAKTWNHPTLAGRYLLVRNSEEMACYELPVQNPGASSPLP